VLLTAHHALFQKKLHWPFALPINWYMNITFNRYLIANEETN